MIVFSGQRMTARQAAHHIAMSRIHGLAVHEHLDEEHEPTEREIEAIMSYLDQILDLLARRVQADPAPRDVGTTGGAFRP